MEEIEPILAKDGFTCNYPSIHLCQTNTSMVVNNDIESIADIVLNDIQKPEKECPVIDYDHMSI